MILLWHIRKPTTGVQLEDIYRSANAINIVAIIVALRSGANNHNDSQQRAAMQKNKHHFH